MASMSKRPRRWIALAAVCAATLCAGPALGAFPGKNGRIAVQKKRNIWTLRPDGSQRHQITDSAPQHFAHGPEISPSGRRIVFWRLGDDANGRLWTVRTNGENEELIARRGDDPDFSPSGRRIVAAQGRSLVLMRTDGTHKRVLKVHGDPGEPTFSPDGKTIVFTGLNKIRAVDRDGSDPRVLFEGREAASPDFSPDGSTIVFTVQTGDSSGDVYAMDADGGSPHPLLESRQQERTAAYSPNGRRIVFARRTTGLFTMRANGTGVRQVADIRVFDPDWGPRP